MDEIIIETLKKLINEKREGKQSPDHILDVEFKRELTRIIKEVVLKLWKEKRIKLGRTVNNNYITLLESN